MNTGSESENIIFSTTDLPRIYSFICNFYKLKYKFISLEVTTIYLCPATTTETTIKLIPKFIYWYV
jgi:hypothetical protein